MNNLHLPTCAKIRRNRIQQIERFIAKAYNGATTEFNVWRQGDCLQALKLYMQRHLPIMEDLIAHKRFDAKLMVINISFSNCARAIDVAC